MTNQVFAGSYHSAFKGRGMSFSEVRNYNYGDDVRNIDWNVTARYDEPFIKVYEEERELTVMLLIDVSKSSFFGTQSQFKNEYITEIAAILAFSAIRNNDKVGVIFFSNKIEKYIPAKKGKSHILRIIRELIEVKPTENGTNIALAMKYFNNTMKRSSIAFIISDFMDKPENYSDGLSIAKKKHDVIGLHIYDEREKKLSDSGLMQFVDSETGKAIWIDTSNKQVQEEYNKHFEECFEATKKGFHKKGADLLSISTSDNYTIALKQMFNRRIQKK
ncbi:MAG: DUF58 domain-containing protein [Chitinophagales bacterium]